MRGRAESIKGTGGKEEQLKNTEEETEISEKSQTQDNFSSPHTMIII